MKKVLLILLCVLPSVCMSAQTKPQFKYDLNFEYDFDNREFDSGNNDYMTSGTIHAMRLTPTFGITIPQNRNLTHNIMAGIDVMKNMGESPMNYDERHLQNWDLFREITIWYNLETSFRGTKFEGYVGMFPRRFSVFGGYDTPSALIPDRNIPSLFLSDDYRFYDNNIEGVLAKFSKKYSYYEVGLDWLGMYGVERREQFKIFSYGKTRFTRGLYGGWAFEAHHYANSELARGVVENFLISPFLEFDFASCLGWDFQRFAFTLTPIGNAHRDRRAESSLQFAMGGQLAFDVRNWNVGIHNETYYGDNLMPYYLADAPEGGIYGADLYHGNPFYRINKNILDNGAGFYDRAEVYYQPHIAKFLDLRLSAVLHFSNDGFEGWQQKFGLVFNLERAMKRNAKTTTSRSGFFEIHL